MENLKIGCQYRKGSGSHNEGVKEDLSEEDFLWRDRNLTPQGRHLCVCLLVKWQEDRLFGDFPGGPVVRALHCRGHGFDPRSGN